MTSCLVGCKNFLVLLQIMSVLLYPLDSYSSHQLHQHGMAPHGMPAMAYTKNPWCNLQIWCANNKPDFALELTCWRRCSDRKLCYPRNFLKEMDMMTDVFQTENFSYSSTKRTKKAYIRTVLVEVPTSSFLEMWRGLRRLPRAYVSNDIQATNNDNDINTGKLRETSSESN